MNNQIRLSTSEIKQVQGQAREKLGECQKGNDVIGVQIFSILSKYARVIYYPLGDGAPWGFTRVEKIRNAKPDGKPFVGINTSISKDMQVYHFGCFLKKLENLPENVIIEACENDMNKIEIVNNYLSYYDEIINKYKKEQPQLPLCNSVVYTNRIKKKLGGNL